MLNFGQVIDLLKEKIRVTYFLPFFFKFLPVLFFYRSTVLYVGGYQLFGRCFLQRIVSLDPLKFSRQLLFHSANNKQRTIEVQRMVKANNLLGQMHSVRNSAIKHMEESLSKKIK